MSRVGICLKLLSTVDLPLPIKRAELTELITFSRSGTEMKKVLLTIAAIALLAAPASAQVYSLWSDETMTSCDFFTEDTYVFYDVFLMITPGPTGVSGAEYTLSMPPGYNINSSVASTLISLTLGSDVGDPGNQPGALCRRLRRRR